MKKLILITTILLLTGCFGEVGKGYITKTCKKQERANDIEIYTNVEIKSKQGKIVNITKIEKYNANNITAILNSKKSEQNLYNKESGIEMTIDSNTFIYNIDVQNTTELVKEKFNIIEEQHKMLKYYEDLGYTCK